MILCMDSRLSTLRTQKLSRISMLVKQAWLDCGEEPIAENIAANPHQVELWHYIAKCLANRPLGVPRKSLGPAVGERGLSEVKRVCRQEV
jgi:hypothetical protein